MARDRKKEAYERWELAKRWDLWNDILNKAKRIYGVEEIPKSNNPYKKNKKGTYAYR